MKKSSRIASALAGIVFLAGCTDTSGGIAKAASAPAKRTGVPKGLEGVGLTGTGFSVVLPDPKRPGKPLWKIWAKTVSGNFASGRGTVRGVTALMFHAGRQAAKMTAPQADYDDSSKTLIASGGVAYESLTQPGTWMRARAVTYHADTGDGVARGGVVIHDGKNGAIAHLPVAYFDASLKLVQSYPLHGGH